MKTEIIYIKRWKQEVSKGNIYILYIRTETLQCISFYLKCVTPFR